MEGVEPTAVICEVELLSPSRSGVEMISDATEWESRQGRVQARYDGETLVLSWLGRVNRPREEEHDGIEMVRFEPSHSILRIFPKVPTLGAFTEQYEQVQELQLDASEGGWDPDTPVAEGRPPPPAGTSSPSCL